MKFHSTSLEGVKRIEFEPRGDARGWLIRTYCEREFGEAGLHTKWVQNSETVTRVKGMLRGMHFQAAPAEEIKLIRCTGGRVWDVLVDVRKDSATYGSWEGFELGPDCGFGLYVPRGIAHGFQCLEDHCVMNYQMSELYVPELARGIRWNDPRVGIRWPLADPLMSERDAGLPYLEG